MAGSQSLDRGLNILVLLDGSPEPLGVREIARQLGLNAATTQRLLNSLAEQNFVQKHKDSRRYGIGYRALGLGASLLTRDLLIASSDRELRRIAATHQLNGYLGQQLGAKAIYLLCVQSNGPIAIRNTPGELTLLHSTAMGKVLLSALSDDQVHALLGPGPLEKVTPHTISDPEVLIDELAEVRNDGFAYVREETLLGVISVGAPVFDASNRIVASLSVAFAERVSPDHTIESVAPIVREAARNVSIALGAAA
ncbi:IclR family transcriptional regulator [Paracoccus onubensis]|uniref:IclR family transcriptional regulator n=1 Tax=Paracoccus onubensis TaxID=1675788 RepID=UPI0027317B28|nr:IclR family transcriptional regulator [Paracoccus onubensis]MDP0930068.1 IclR family transcriptional regulator [Paracoccus onubensis]